MQIVIDIPEHIYEHAKETTEDSRDEFEAMRAIANGSQQRTGRWRKVSMDKYIQHATYYYECSECGDQHIGQVNYCPNCGARMEVEE